MKFKRPFRTRATGLDRAASAFPEVEATRTCPHCGEQVSRGATVCLHCERDLAPVMSPVAFQSFLQTRGIDTRSESQEGDHADQS